MDLLLVALAALTLAHLATAGKFYSGSISSREAWTRTRGACDLSPGHGELFYQWYPLAGYWHWPDTHTIPGNNVGGPALDLYKRPDVYVYDAHVKGGGFTGVCWGKFWEGQCAGGGWFEAKLVCEVEAEGW